MNDRGVLSATGLKRCYDHIADVVATTEECDMGKVIEVEFPKGKTEPWVVLLVKIVNDLNDLLILGFEDMPDEVSNRVVAIIEELDQMGRDYELDPCFHEPTDG